MKIVSSIKKLVQKLGSILATNFLGYLSTALFGVVIACVVFFLTSHQRPPDKIEADLRKEITSELRRYRYIYNESEPVFTFFSAFKIAIDEDAVLAYGNYAPEAPTKDSIDEGKTGLFVAVFEPAAKSLLDSIAGREPSKTLSLLFVLPYLGGDEHGLKNLSSQDSFRTGKNALLFDIYVYYADGTAVSPVILYKDTEKWHFVAIPDFSDDAKKTLSALSKDKSIRFTAEQKQTLAESVDGPLFMERWRVQRGDKKAYIGALRNSSGYKYYFHPEYGYKQILIAAAFRDDVVNAPHHIFWKTLKLEKYRWITDDTWIGGSPGISIKPLDFDNVDFDKTYKSGYESHDHTYYWGPSFSRELRGCKN